MGIRWMLVQEDLDESRIFIARGAKRAWYQDSPFGIADAPTRFGLVTFSFTPSSSGVSGSISFHPNPGVAVATLVKPEFSVRIRSADTTKKLSNVNVQGATMVSLCANNETVVFLPSATTFTFT